MAKIPHVSYRAENVEAMAKFFIDAMGVTLVQKREDGAVISGNVDERFLRAPQLRWVHCDAAGLERSAAPAVFEKGLQITSSSGRTAPALAEHCLFFMLAFAYRFTDFRSVSSFCRNGASGTGELPSGPSIRVVTP